ncbi:Radical SAM superfamily enzyme YgiQ, UPF0313 family [Geosporobacter subterraneus DSM 17957]|uniref:Radical SAM superfamily enzyme YgiQ, UPF0313 family n=1 Tax=Geosporobacter subterraneus DSM 17957 TaxID=1121919 RepID=A0A1M6FPK7_9FIRM|nr:radical SAM protein [Geosporobacter subterraneus]SHI99661.1 Radical SAM superfamily enzyme YgiQ, UPF0313 family [Geosporobacter subterraneus DSM 17957]
MKIKLIQPRMSLRPVDSEFKRLMAPPLALLTLAALTPLGDEVIIEDENVADINYDDLPDLVGISVNIDTSQRAYTIGENYRKRGVPVVVGGIHVSANPDEALNYVDSVCIGEAESLWQQIVEDARKGQLKTKYYSEQPTDLEKIPIMNWNRIPVKNYLYNNVVITSRGCPFQCDFCYNSCEYVHNVYRNRPIEDVIQEINMLGTKHIMFIDDNFIGNIQWTREFVRRIKPLKLKWNAAVSINIGEYLDLLDEMKESGCQSLFIGFESINEQSISSVHKMQNKRTNYENVVREIHKRGIMINASLVFGLDHDDKSVFQSTLDWLVKNKIETMTAHILTPYPGTKLYKRMEQEGRIIDFNLKHYNTAHVVFAPLNMTKQELYDGYLWMYQEFYSFRNILRRMPERRDQQIPYLLFNLLYRKFGKALSFIGKRGFMNRFGKLARRLAYGVS